MTDELHMKSLKLHIELQYYRHQLIHCNCRQDSKLRPRLRRILAMNIHFR